MYAFLYLVVMIWLGDVLCRRFCKYVSSPHRFAAAFLVGLLFSTWTTYLIARAFANTSRPLMFGNLGFLALAGAVIYFLRRKDSVEGSQTQLSEADTRAKKADWIVTAILFLFVSWMMFSSFNMRDGNLQIANHQWSDFGPNVALMQSFALGQNFPTEYPHFAGDRIRYHFLFYFQAGNLEYLGLNPAVSNNLLSIFSMVSMLVLVMALGFLIFNSRAVGRMGAALFFFHGSLAYIPFLRSQNSIGEAFKAATALNTFLPSGFPYRGEEWGMWSLVNFINQRHFASGIGILLLAIAFLVERYQSARAENQQPELKTRDELETNTEGMKSNRELFLRVIKENYSFIFFGVLIGLLPMWNGAVLLAAGAILVAFLVLFPLRVQLLMLLASTAIVALPQVIYLRSGNIRAASYSLFHWGYTITDPTIPNVIKYLGYTFGFKWLLIGVALVWMSGFQRRIVLAVSSLVAVAFIFQFSEEVLANHKFMNIWLVVANLFVAYGVWRLWKITTKQLPIRIATAAIIFLVTIGGVIDLFPIHRAYWAEIPFEGDALLRWTQEHTDPRAVFLSDRFVTHQILLAGRRVFFGWPYFSWGTGYKTDERQAVYQRLFQEKDPSQLLRLLTQNNIAYVAIDDGLRRGDFISNLNEAVYENHFERVFHDSENKYGGLSIFKVPSMSSGSPEQQVNVAAADETNLPAVNAFQGGRGMARGQFASARGIAVDAEGNIFVADTGNSRVQKFSRDGEFVASIGRAGTGVGQLRDPVGVAVDNDGNVFVSDSGTHQLIKFSSDGKFESQWPGPAPGFYGPLDVTIGPQGYLYVVDQGRARIVIVDRSGNTIKEWGKKGKGRGEFDDPTGIAVSADRVYVADLKNSRVEVFDLEGKFLVQWQVPQWAQQVFHNPDILCDQKGGKVYVSSGATNEVLVFDLSGKSLGLKKPEKTKFDRPSGLALGETENSKRLYVMNTDGANLSWIDLGPKEVLHSASTAVGPARN